MNQSISFHFFKSLPFALRLIAALLLIAGGVFWQLISGLPTPGWIFLLAASILLMYKGVDKRIIKNSIFHNADWKKISREQVQQIIDTKRKLAKWDHSFFESSGCLGGGILLLLIGTSLVIIIAEIDNLYLTSVGLDMLVLFLPQFFSGMKRYDQLIKPVFYATKILEAATTLEIMYPEVKIEFLVLLGIKKNMNLSVPKEVKMKITFGKESQDFLGMYGQLSVNMVGSNMFPYFYTVQVYKTGFGLKEKMKKIKISDTNIIKEFKSQEEVEVLVIRQYTTKTSGYHTKPKQVEKILHESVRAYEMLNE